jgi:hypothetical protein
MNQELTKLSQIPWLVKWATDVKSSLGGSFEVDVDGGLVVTPDATESDMKGAAASLLAIRTRSSQVSRVVDRFIGNLINHHALAFKANDKESIQALGLCDTDGRSMRSLSRLARIVRNLDAETLTLPNLTTKHFDIATAFKGPEDESKAEWKNAVKDILVEASEDPTERGSSWVSDKMKQLQKSMGIDTGRSAPASEVLKHIAELSFILNKWTAEDFSDEENDGVTRSVVVDHYEALMNEAIIRCMISNPDDKATYVFP